MTSYANEDYDCPVRGYYRNGRGHSVLDPIQFGLYRKGRCRYCRQPVWSYADTYTAWRTAIFIIEEEPW